MIRRRYLLQINVFVIGSILSFSFIGYGFAATLTLSPSSQTINVDDILTIDIVLNTEGDGTHGVDINALNYDASILEVQDEDSGASGVQILPGSLMSITTFNDISNGKIIFSQIPSGGQVYSGQGVLASIRFKAIQAGTTNVDFDFVLGNTLDTNVASNGHDALVSVVNGIYTINTAGSPTPTPTPAPSGGGGGSLTGSGSSSGGGGSIPLTTPTPTPISGAYPTKPSDYGLNEGDMISAIGSNDPDIYIINEFGYKRLFLNPIIFNFYGHLGGWSNVKTINPGTRDAFLTTQYFRNCETNDSEIYALNVTGEDSGTLHHLDISGDQAVIQDSNFFNKVFCINNNEFNWYQKASPYNSLSSVPIYTRNQLNVGSQESAVLRSVLVKTASDPTVYYINSKGIKKSVPAGDVFASYGNKIENVIIISVQELNLYSDYDGIVYNGEVYILDNGTKRLVKNADAFNRLGLDLDKIVSINEIEFNYYSTGSEIN